MKRAADLFAGAGGWSTGAAAAGVHVVASVNHWPRAVETHAANHPNTSHICQDVALVDPRDFGRFELLLASPSCQGHSRARGKERPHHDAARATAGAVLDVLEVCRPPVVLVENVPEMLEWVRYGAWRFGLEALGYVVREHVLDAADFGVPQHRRRLFVSAVRQTRGRRVPALELRHPGRPHVAAETLIDWGANGWRPVGGLAAATRRRWEAGRAAFGERFLLPYYGSARTGRSLQRPIGTVPAADVWAVVDGERMRMLTVEELRRAMGFPEGYWLAGGRQDQTALLGNAVPPPVAEELVRQALAWMERNL